MRTLLLLRKRGNLYPDRGREKVVGDPLERLDEKRFVLVDCRRNLPDRVGSTRRSADVSRAGKVQFEGPGLASGKRLMALKMSAREALSRGTPRKSGAASSVSYVKG